MARLIPDALDPDHDYLHVPEQLPPLWSENLILVTHDPDAGIAVFAHMSRMQPDPNVWEGALAVFEAGGDVLVDRSFAVSRASDRASSGAMVYQCVKPHHHWRLTFDGMARRISRADSAAGPVGDGEVERLEMELGFEGNGPLWSIGDDDMRSQDWADVHVEHAGDVHGTVLIGGREIAVTSRGIRDHSRGPRDYSTLLREGWSWGFFPEGRMFLVLRVWQDSGADLLRGFVFDGQELTEATSVQVPPVESALGEPEAFSLSLSGPFGDHVVQGHLLHSCAYTLHRPIGMAAGVDYSRPELTVTVEGPATFEWQGQRGSGWMERMARASTLRRPPDHS